MYFVSIGMQDLYRKYWISKILNILRYDGNKEQSHTSGKPENGNVKNKSDVVKPK